MGRANARSVGMSSTMRGARWYSMSVASSAASVSLPQRRPGAAGSSSISRSRPAAAHDQARLRPSEDFVAAERDDVCTRGDALGDERFLRQAVCAEVDERAAAEILHDRNPVRSSDRHELGQADLGVKPDDAVIARVDLEDQAAVCLPMARS